MNILVKTALALSLGISGSAFAQSMPDRQNAPTGGQSACPAGDPSCQKGGSGGSSMQGGGVQQAPRATDGKMNDGSASKSERLNNQAGSGGSTGEPRRAEGDRQPAAGQNAESDKPARPAEQKAEDKAKGEVGKETTAAIPNVNVTVQQKTEIRQVITQTKVRPVNVDINISVGVVVPRTVELYPLPPRIVEIVPAYRDYVYFLLADGRIVIIEPASHKVVVIIA